MTWLSFFIGYCVGMMVALLIMRKVFNEQRYEMPFIGCLDNQDIKDGMIDKSVEKEMKQLQELRKDKE
ncbi:MULTISPECIES: hypothetical protein [Bacillus cereus group]|uniref:hypothetical protein n=1 Tax=Bacillus cereus group TaxID=86661 RepID=UPI0011CB7B4C|nr:MULTISPECIES: hypothetical protein [Bacillus cereus group]QWG81200.1 hypothetical protein EXW27_27900 [Bacillus mycoides]TXR82007.1 hypothetical protein DN408_10835 [Bacillus sp. AR13-1]